MSGTTGPRTLVILLHFLHDYDISLDVLVDPGWDRLMLSKTSTCLCASTSEMFFEDIPGILSANGSVCCARLCGQCGGAGCFQAPGGTGGGCIGGVFGILATQGTCSASGAAPCAVGEQKKGLCA